MPDLIYQMMKIKFANSVFTVSLFFASFSLANAAVGKPEKNAETKLEKKIKNLPVHFLENNGQMLDMKKNPVPFVLFKASFPGMNVYVTEKGLTYVFVKMDEKIEEGNEENQLAERINTKVAWINLSLQGAHIRRDQIIEEGAGVEKYNYFFPQCKGGIYGVNGYERITVKNIYPGVDWVLYGTEKSGMKYDFIVHEGSAASSIKLIYESEEPLSIDKSGAIEIKTRLGTLHENAPCTFFLESHEKISSQYKAQQLDTHHVEVSFSLDEYGKNTIVIDPQLWWGTLYGGSTDELDGPSSIDVDDNGNLYVVGYTTSPDFPVMNSGTYYDSVLVGGIYDLFIMKFTNSGVLLWSTYYGGSGDERSPYEVPFITTDVYGNLFIVGETFSTDFPLQNAGTYFNSTFNGSLNYISDAFILKFDSSGNRLWATYFGGDNQDRILSAATGPSGNLFITGFSNSAADFPLQSWGAAYFDSTFNGGTSDAFISEFTNAGNLTWSSYLGGSAEDHGISITTDASGNVFLTGESASTDFPLQNNGTYYDDTSGGTDVILVKFDIAGNLVWSTYFGGSALFTNEWGLSIRTDKFNNVFVMGNTNSQDFPLLNAGTYFDSLIGFADKDMFISKFSNAGSLLWSSYFGGTGTVNTSWDFLVYDNLEIDTSGNVYISFNRGVDSVPTYDPGCGAYFNTAGRIALAEFSNTGTLLWGTYIGASSAEVRGPLAVDNAGNLFIAGEFNGYASIAGLPLLDPGGGAYYSTNLGPAISSNHQAFQLKFIPDAPCVIVTNFTANDNHICPGTCINFINGTTGATSYQWYFPGGVPDSSADVNPQNICYPVSGSYPVSLIATNAGGSDTLTLNSYITVYPSPLPQGILQSGDTLFAIPGATSYQWFYNGNILPGATNYFYVAVASGDYNIVATDANGCEVEAVIYNVIAGIETHNESQLDVYPNPASDQLTFEFSEFESKKISLNIFNTIGERINSIKHGSLNQRCIQIDIAGISPGVYWIEIGFDEVLLRAKFLKQ